MTEQESQTVARVAEEVQRRLSQESSGHDWWHVFRVWKMAERLASEERANLFVCSLAALLHDIADWKAHDGDETVGPRVAREILTKEQVSNDVIDHVADIIATMSFKGAGVASPMNTKEGEVVQDADRLDAMGAIGIARAFAYGGHKGRLLYDPNRPPEIHSSKDAYFKSEGTTINHFYEKLLLLKKRMNTNTAKRIAEARHRYMEAYLEEFFAEWEGKR